MNKLTIWRIALAVPVAAYFDYLPCHASAPPQAGCRVKVPFGTRSLIGVFLQVVHETPWDNDKLKSVTSVLDEQPLLDAILLQLCYWASDYYHSPLGEVVVSSLPKALRAGKALPPAIKKASATVLNSEEPLSLNSHQAAALQAIVSQAHFQVSLLAGVTGSGKTEVYLQAIAAVLKRGKTALVLVPEINLTPQTVARFEKRFTAATAVIHSRLTEAKRVKTWAQIYHDQVDIVIGTRSAIFSPIKRLGIIVVDEEHDASFKSQHNLRYSARDLAIIRAQFEDVPIVLGSATPCLETYYNAIRGRYQHLSLPVRAANATLPTTTLVNLCQQSLRAGLSQTLIAAIKKQLEANKQVLLFLNRRGYAPSLICHHCGHMVECQRCDAKMTLHKHPERLVCHHCDTHIKPMRICPKCQQVDLIPVGQGTEKIEQTLCELFPHYSVLRVDRDTSATPKQLQQKLEQIYSGAAHILVGTQMLAKGHHFPQLGLSAILDVDSGFFSLDFRAIERLAQLIVQVSGRAGRGELAGEVILQTYQPQHPHLQLLLKEGYMALMQALLKERKSSTLPPFSFQAMIWAKAGKPELPIAFLEQAKRVCRQGRINVFGPIPAALERRAGQFRQCLLLQSASRVTLKAVLQDLQQQIQASKLATRVRWAIDVDPLQIC